MALYLANLALVSLLFPAWRGNEPGVLFTHAVFGLIVGGAYRGLLKRRTAEPVRS
jgi:membrane associated rhomboid family serine protease